MTIRSFVRCRQARRHVLFPIVCAAAVVSVSGANRSTPPRPTLPAELETVRVALEKYQDPIVAIHDGYFSTLGCMAYPKPGGPGQAPYPAGGMGIHFFNVNEIRPVPDPLRPTVLLYEPDGTQLRLVAAEWFVPLSTGIKQRPRLFGADFDGPMEGHHPLMPLAMHHYDLHVWVFKENPAGLFRPTNPTVKCGTYPFSFEHEPPRLVNAS